MLLTAQTVHEQGFRGLIVVLVQLADDRLEQVVAVSTGFCLDDGLKDVEETLTLEADRMMR